MRNTQKTQPQEFDMNEFRNYFATLNRNILRDTKRNTNDRSSVTFSSYTIDQILTYLRSPESNAANLRKLSRQLYHSSTHYRRLINYYAFMPLWYYTVSPLGYDPAKSDPVVYRKQYLKAIHYLENANIAHEMSKVYAYGLIDGIFYGVIWQSNNSFFIQHIDPDYCHISAIEDGRYCFSFDFSRIKESQLYLYPPEFSTLYQKYKNGGDKEQEIPSSISFVYKPDETTLYCVPPFISLAPDVFNLENTREILSTATELDNYKLLQLIVETKDGMPSMPMQLNTMFLEHIQKAVPEGIGVVMSPGKLQEITFDRSRPTNSTDELSDAISSFWYNSGTMGSLFGNPKITAASAIRIAIKVDEEYVFGCMRQLERIINALLKQLSGKYKFQMQFIPCTVFSRDDVANSLKTAATLGVPGSKLAYAATIGIQQSTLEGLAFVENTLINTVDNWLPLSSSYTQASDDQGGRPPLPDGEESESTDRGRDNDSGANKEEE